ncbi:MAG: 2-oxoacid:acceptor oxidoreductase subunit alpha [Nitrososphaerales archaeon]|nr:2-oxoacid:acceptor oxidoreductase subunit alpha [Nitrososphaerales archaeon]
MSKNGGVLSPGTYFMMGNFACVEAAIMAGCRLFAGYPITPSSEIFERACTRFPQVGGYAVEMEDEIASMAALVGASYAGSKVMTATSGPGFSLMMENIGLAFMMEAPSVVVNVQRGGPSTGVPTLVGQGDMMQARWGTHGDTEMIAYCPSSVQEFFDLTIQAFNTAEKFRTPVFVMADQVVGMMSERLRVPPIEEIEIVERLAAKPPGSSDLGLPFDYSRDFVPMPIAGTGCRVNVESLTHDSRGYPSTEHSVSQAMMAHLLGKIRNHASEIWRWQEYLVDDADVVVIAYGSTARSALSAVKAARSKQIKAGLLRLITPWPFPDKIVEKISSRVNTIVVPEINYGQMIHPIRENSKCPVVGVNLAPGTLIEPRTITDALELVA